MAGASKANAPRTERVLPGVWRLRLPPMPVSKRTMPSPAATAQALPCGTPGQGSGSRSRQIPGSVFSARGASALSAALIAAILPPRRGGLP